MFYLTGSDTGHPRAYRVFLSDTRILVDDEPWDEPLCIVDIDECEACVLALKGFGVFKVKLVPCDRPTYLFYAIVDDIDAVKDWWIQCYT